MSFVARHVAAILIVLAACLAALGVFAFARPQYHPLYESKMMDFSKQYYYDAGTVRRAFTARHIELYAGEKPAVGTATFSSDPAFHADAVQVIVGPRTGTGSFGPKLESYDERFGNVMVTYGGHDEHVLGRVKAAVNDLRLIP
jgi:hypothetical protein